MSEYCSLVEKLRYDILELFFFFSFEDHDGFRNTEEVVASVLPSDLNDVLVFIKH